MGLYLRRSVRVGPLRFNLSGSGIGVSCGIPGFRIGTGPRGNYIHAGRGGIYYRKTFGAGSQPSSEVIQPSQLPDYQPALVDATIGELQPVDTGTSAAMQDSSSQSLLDELNQKHQRLRLWPMVLLSGIAALGVAKLLGLPDFAIGLVACIATVGVIFTAYRDTLRKTTVLMYDLDDNWLGAFANLDAAFDQASATQCVWHLKAKADVLDRKYHAGASSVLDAEKTRLFKSAPPGLKTNILPLAAPLDRKTLYFFPDRILILDAVGFGAVSYQNLHLNLETSGFVTGEVAAPSDAHILSYTWRYVNKRGGGPDRRFNNNPQLPVIETGDLALSCDSGFSGILKFSNVAAAQTLVNGIHEFTSIKGRAVADRDSPSRADAQTPPPLPQDAAPAQSKGRSTAIAFAILVAIAAGMVMFYQLGRTSARQTTHLDSRSSQRSQSSQSILPPKQHSAAEKRVVLVATGMPTGVPNVERGVVAVSKIVKPAPNRTFGIGERFVTLLAPTSIRSSSGKTIMLSNGSRFPLTAIENDQAVIRYYDGRTYSVPVAATDYR